MKNKQGITLLELIVVVTIISLFSVFSVLSFRASKDSILVNSAIEILNDELNRLNIQVLIEKLSSYKAYFSISHPRLYYHTDIFNISDSYIDDLGRNIRIQSDVNGNKLISEASLSNNGSISLEWDQPVNDKNVKFSARIGKEIIKEETITKPVNTMSLNHLNKYQKYEFYLNHPEKIISSERLVVMYYSQDNISESEGNQILLKKIEVQSFSGDWQPVNDSYIHYNYITKKLKVFSENKEFKKLRLTFERNKEESQFQI